MPPGAKAGVGVTGLGEADMEGGGGRIEDVRVLSPASAKENRQANRQLT